MANQSKKLRAKPHTKQPPSAFDKAWNDMRSPPATPPTVSARWLIKALAFAVVMAALCCWAALCLLFWQGSWQLLYHPSAAVARTPASAGLAFDSVRFAASETGQTRLAGWWIPSAPNAEFSRTTVLYLHGQNGNLGNTIDELVILHSLGVNVLAFDYRGYGQSQFARPSEAHWREDVEWALAYLTGTRQISPGQIVLDGEGLGANLALAVTAARPELAGAILNDPVPDSTSVIFSDARARLVPARALVRDRYDLEAPAALLRTPSLWLLSITTSPNLDLVKVNSAYKKVSARKMLVWIRSESSADKPQTEALTRWLADLGSRAH